MNKLVSGHVPLTFNFAILKICIMAFSSESTKLLLGLHMNLQPVVKVDGSV